MAVKVTDYDTVLSDMIEMIPSYNLWRLAHQSKSVFFVIIYLLGIFTISSISLVSNIILMVTQIICTHCKRDDLGNVKKTLPRLGRR